MLKYGNRHIVNIVVIKGVVTNSCSKYIRAIEIILVKLKLGSIMVMKLFFRNWLVLALLLVPTLLSAQEVVDSVDVDPYEGMIIETYYTEDGGTASDTIYLDDRDEDSLKIARHDLKEYEWVDICSGNPKYAIVTKDGKKGIFDLVLYQEVTPVEFREVGFYRQDIMEDSLFFNIFYAKEGIKRGILSVDESTNNVLSIWMDDPDEVYSLDECTTIDKKITKRAKNLLEGFVQKEHLDNAQIVILETETGRLITWIRLDSDSEKDEAGKLIVHSCAGSLTKPFHTIMALENEGVSLDSIYNGISYRQGIKKFNNVVMHQTIMNGYRRSVAERKWRELTDTRNPSTSPFIMAVGYNSLAHNGTMIIPTMKEDSVNVEKDVFSPTNITNLIDVLRVDKAESPQLAWLSDGIDWLGYATTESIYSNEDKEMKNPIGKQIQFAGVFPAEDPKYTICVVADKQSLDIEPAVFQDVVNPLSQWLLKKK